MDLTRFSFAVRLWIVLQFYIGLENDHSSPGNDPVDLTWSKNLPSPGQFDSSSLNSYIKAIKEVRKLLVNGNIIFGFLGFLAVWVGLLHNPLFEGDGNLCKKLWHITFTCSTRKNSFGPKARSAPVIASSVVWFWSNLTVVFDCKFQ